MTAEDYPQIGHMEYDVNQHGEVHATVEEHDAEVECRAGVTEFNYRDGVIEVEGRHTTQVFSMDSVVSWYRPKTVFET